jgi:nucleoid-associated protein YgaU
MIAPMRSWIVISCAIVAGGAAAACGRPTAASSASDGALLLEVGGVNSSLREALAAAGIVTAPPHRLRPEPEPVPAPEPMSAPAAGGAAEAADPREVASDPPVPPPAVAEHVEVRLAKGQTLIHLAKQHLGDGNRFREILDLNGWDEADARRLREGQVVKVPKVAKSTGRAPGGSSTQVRR